MPRPMNSRSSNKRSLSMLPMKGEVLPGHPSYRGSSVIFAFGTPAVVGCYKAVNFCQKSDTGPDLRLTDYVAELAD